MTGPLAVVFDLDGVLLDSEQRWNEAKHGLVTESGGTWREEAPEVREGARAAILFHSCVPPSEFGGWPGGVPLQIHIMDRDPHASPPEMDLETARRVDAELGEATFFSYPGEQHLFADDSLPSFDADAAARAEARVLELLATL